MYLHQPHSFTDCVKSVMITTLCSSCGSFTPIYSYKLICHSDEVQSGFGRTGKYFAVEHSGVRPDILVIAKGIANGFPLSAIVTRKELTDKMPKVRITLNIKIHLTQFLGLIGKIGRAHV